MMHCQKISLNQPLFLDGQHLGHTVHMYTFKSKCNLNKEELDALKISNSYKDLIVSKVDKNM